MSNSYPSEEQLFERCLELPPEEWESFLNSTCAKNESLREGVLSLLRSHQKQGGFLDSVPEEGSASPVPPLPASEAEKPPPAKKKPGKGRYLLLFLVLAAGVFGFWQFTNESREDALTHIGVAPFELVASEGIGPGFTSDLQQVLADRLSSLEGVQVLAVDSDELRDTLGKHPPLLLVGDIQSLGNRVRIHINLVDLSDQQTLWAQSSKRVLTSGNHELIHQEVAATTSNAIVEFLELNDSNLLTIPPSFHPEALEHYQAGMKIINSSLKSVMAEAIEHFQSALKLDPNLTLAYVGLARSYRQSEGLLVGNITEEKRNELMMAAMVRALGMDEDLPEVQVLWGEIKAEEGDRAGAMTAFKRALQFDPECADAYAALANLESNREVPESDPRFESHMEEVVRLQKKAVELAPDRPKYLLELGWIMTHLGRRAESNRLYEQAIALNPEFAEAHSRLGINFGTYEGRFDIAIQRYLRALHLDPYNQEFWEGLLFYYESVGEIEKAIEMCHTLAQSMPGEQTIYHANGLYLEGKDEEAYQIYRYLYEHSEDDWFIARRRLLNIDLRAGRFEQARRRYFATMVELFQENPVIENYGQALYAMELVPILLGLNKRASIDMLVEGSWRYFSQLPENDFTHAFQKILYHQYKGDTAKALDAFEKAIGQGIRFKPDLEDARLDPLRTELRFIAAMKVLEEDLANQRAHLRRMEAKGELEPIPNLNP